MQTIQLIQAYRQTGILQFGRFERSDGQFAPFAFNFLLLPSYPSLLHSTAEALRPLLPQPQPERLLASRSSVPLATALALTSNLPLTYPYGQATTVTNAFSIEGAYDIGHSTTLLDAQPEAESLLPLIETAARVGLQTQQVLCLVPPAPQLHTELEARGIQWAALLDLRACFAELHTQGRLPATLHTTLQTWLNPA
ncbi:MAG: hypothetical protein HC915_14130 [Anaerolineae bacterium]|nr:hypothetical protein [Anaerolineae bacterium]